VVESLAGLRVGLSLGYRFSAHAAYQEIVTQKAGIGVSMDPRTCRWHCCFSDAVCIALSEDCSHETMAREGPPRTVRITMVAAAEAIRPSCKHPTAVEMGRRSTWARSFSLRNSVRSRLSSGPT